MEHYKHTQIGYVTGGGIIAGMILIISLMANSGFDPIAAGVLVILGVSLLLFCSLTVIVTDSYLDIKFGVTSIRKRIELRDIESAKAVQNQWYYFWGIRLTPHGRLYNVSGLKAVEIEIINGEKFRIGTDDPIKLEEAINQVIKG